MQHNDSIMSILLNDSVVMKVHNKCKSSNMIKEVNCAIECQENDNAQLRTTQEQINRIAKAYSCNIKLLLMTNDTSTASDATHRDIADFDSNVYQHLIKSGHLKNLVENGKRFLFISHLDNLGAVVNLRLLSHFVKSQAPLLREYFVPTSDSPNTSSLVHRNCDGELTLPRHHLDTTHIPSDDSMEACHRTYTNTGNVWVRIDKLLEACQEDKIGDDVFPMDDNSFSSGSFLSFFEGAEVIEVPRSRYNPIPKPSQRASCCLNIDESGKEEDNETDTDTEEEEVNHDRDRCVDSINDSIKDGTIVSTPQSYSYYDQDIDDDQIKNMDNYYLNDKNNNENNSSKPDEYKIFMERYCEKNYSFMFLKHVCFRRIFIVKVLNILPGVEFANYYRKNGKIDDRIVINPTDDSGIITLRSLAEYFRYVENYEPDLHTALKKLEDLIFEAIKIRLRLDITEFHVENGYRAFDRQIIQDLPSSSNKLSIESSEEATKILQELMKKIKQTLNSEEISCKESFNSRNIRYKIIARVIIPLFPNTKYNHVKQSGRWRHNFIFYDNNGQTNNTTKIWDFGEWVYHINKIDAQLGSFIRHIDDVIFQSIDDNLKSQRKYWKEKGYKALEYRILQDIMTKLRENYNPTSEKTKKMLDTLLSNGNENFNQQHITQVFTDFETNFIVHFKNCFMDGLFCFIDDGDSCGDVLCKILKCNLDDLNENFGMDDDDRLASYDLIGQEDILENAEHFRRALVSV